MLVHTVSFFHSTFSTTFYNIIRVVCRAYLPHISYVRLNINKTIYVFALHARTLVDTPDYIILSSLDSL